MKIMLCGSMHFAKEMHFAKDELEKIGFEVLFPDDLYDCLTNEDLKSSFEKDFDSELKHCVDRDLLRSGFNRIEKSDVLLFINYPKNEIQGYIGASSLMEMGVAFFLRKKIFLLYPIDRQQKYALEVELTEPTVLDGDINNIKKYLGV